MIIILNLQDTQRCLTHCQCSSLCIPSLHCGDHTFIKYKQNWVTIVFTQTIQNILFPWEVIIVDTYSSDKHFKEVLKYCGFVFAFPLRKDIFCIYLDWHLLGDTLEGEFPMSGGHQLFIQWHGGLSTTLTAAEVALRLRTSMDECVSHVYPVSPCKPSCFLSFFAKQPLALCWQQLNSFSRKLLN